MRRVHFNERLLLRNLENFLYTIQPDKNPNEEQGMMTRK